MLGEQEKSEWITAALHMIYNLFLCYLNIPLVGYYAGKQIESADNCLSIIVKGVIESFVFFLLRI